MSEVLDYKETKNEDGSVDIHLEGKDFHVPLVNKLFPKEFTVTVTETIPNPKNQFCPIKPSLSMTFEVWEHDNPDAKILQAQHEAMRLLQRHKKELEEYLKR